jgi:hypothetical protein
MDVRTDPEAYGPHRTESRTFSDSEPILGGHIGRTAVEPTGNRPALS